MEIINEQKTDGPIDAADIRNAVIVDTSKVVETGVENTFIQGSGLDVAEGANANPVPLWWAEALIDRFARRGPIPLALRRLSSSKAKQLR